MTKASILIVEDEGVVAMDIRHRLEAMDYRVLGIASTGNRALQEVENGKPDLVLMDIKLKGDIDGIEAAEIIRQKLNVPVIFLTAFTDDVTLKRARISEAYGYILKPFEEKELYTNIEIALYKHQMEEKLQESERLYRFITENTHDVIWKYDPYAERITFVSSTVFRQNGFSVAEMISRSIKDLLTPESYSFIQRELPQRLEALKAGDETVRINTDLLEEYHKNGSLFYIEVVTTILTDEKNRITELIGVTRDVTKRKLAEDALKLSEECERDKAKELEAVLEAVPVAVFISHDRECKTMTGNRAAYELVRLPRGTNPSKSAPEAQLPSYITLRDGKEIPSEELPMQRSAANGSVASAPPCTLRFEDGTEIDVIGTAVPLLDDEGRPAGAVGAFVDITEQKRAEQEILELNRTLEQRVLHRTAQIELANRQLELIAYSIAHTLRAPLRAINGYSNILLSEYAPILDPQGVKHLENLKDASLKISDMIDGLLELLRVTTEKLELGNVDLSQIAQAIMKDLKNSEPARRIDFICPASLCFQADLKMMNLMLKHLLTNAWKFTRDRSPAVIEFGSCDENGKTILFLKDNGIGFDVTYKGQLFRLFQQLIRPNEYKGVGIGLAVVERVIQRHGGQVWADGVVEKGAVFYFTLP